MTGLTTSVWLTTLDQHVERHPDTDYGMLAEILSIIIRKAEQNDVEGIFKFLDERMADMIESEVAQ